MAQQSPATAIIPSLNWGSWRRAKEPLSAAHHPAKPSPVRTEAATVSPSRQAAERTAHLLHLCADVVFDLPDYALEQVAVEGRRRLKRRWNSSILLGAIQLAQHLFLGTGAVPSLPDDVVRYVRDRFENACADAGIKDAPGQSAQWPIQL